MGTEFDAFEDNAQTRYFENMIAQGQRLSPKEETAAENRRLLFHVLTSVGFTNHLEEWWHYDFGNQFWGCIKKQPAIYGPIMDLSSVRS
jgi:D-alanyl-D-alanine dipeptidase